MSAAEALPGTVDTSSDDLMVLTAYVDDRMLGIPILRVQDVMNPQQITHVPLAPPEVIGLLNLRGRIVTVLDVRTRLGLPQLPDNAPRMCVTVELRGELYSLLVDRVGDVITVTGDDFESNPGTLERRWRDVSRGIVRLDNSLMVVLDVDEVLKIRDR